MNHGIAPHQAYFAGDLAMCRRLAVEVEAAQTMEDRINVANRDCFARFAQEATANMDASTTREEIRVAFRRFRDQEVKRLQHRALSRDSSNSRLRDLLHSYELRKASVATRVDFIPGAVLLLRLTRFALVLSLFTFVMGLLMTAGLVQVLVRTLS